MICVWYTPFVFPPCSPPLCICPIMTVGLLLLHPNPPFVFLPTKTLDCPKYSPIKLFIRPGKADRLPLPSGLKPWGEQGGALDIFWAKAGSYSCHHEDMICIDSSVGIIFCGCRQWPIEYLPPMAAGGGGPHNKSPRWGSGLLGGFFYGRPQVSTMTALGPLRIGNPPLLAIFR